MGCNSSKNAFRVDDSIHVMLAHSKKQPGPHVYIPRAPHPLLVPKEQRGSVSNASTVASEDDMNGIDKFLRDEKALQAQKEEDRLLYHAKHHNDTVDPRDYSYDSRYALKAFEGSNHGYR